VAVWVQKTLAVLPICFDLVDSYLKVLKVKKHKMFVVLFAYPAYPTKPMQISDVF
jgi:hypothetical protein